MSNEGKKVSVHYVGTLDDGTQFDSSRDRGVPLDFVCMAGQMIPGFDAAVRDMEPGETVTVRLEPADAYGEYDESLLQSVPISNLPGAEDLEEGAQVMLSSGDGRRFPARVAKVGDDEIVFDLNHELAGKPLTFEIELLSVE